MLMTKMTRPVINLTRGIPGMFLASVTMLAGLFTAAGPLRAAIIGDDNLLDWHEEPDATVRESSRATAVLIQKSRGWLVPEAGGWALAGSVPSFGEADGICSGERFSSQKAPGDCSGFLAGPDVLVTARHCVAALGGCPNLHVVFDFVVASPDQPGFHFDPGSVFSCASVIASDEGRDWAAIKLDRPVHGRIPLRLGADPASRGPVGMSVAVWGHPRGLPLKIAAGAAVREPSGMIDPEWSEDYFEADLDVFGGSSGAPVVNTATGEVEGILVTGFGEFEDPEQDPRSGGECRRLRRMSFEEATFPWVSRLRGVQNLGVLPGAYPVISR